MKTNQLILLTLATCFAAVAAVRAEDAKLPPASTKADITYATDIKPIFDASCVKCHSGEKAKARLHMDTLEGVLKGTKQGAIVVAGDPEKSLLVKSVAHLTKDPEGWMPPPNNKAGIKQLTPEEIGLVIGWIKQGAK
jgi:mono/diheme cytochrome c family protein